MLIKIHHATCTREGIADKSSTGMFIDRDLSGQFFELGIFGKCKRAFVVEVILQLGTIA